MRAALVRLVRDAQQRTDVVAQFLGVTHQGLVVGGLQIVLRVQSMLAPDVDQDRVRLAQRRLAGQSAPATRTSSKSTPARCRAMRILWACWNPISTAPILIGATVNRPAKLLRRRLQAP